MANTEPIISNKSITIVRKTTTSISIRWNRATDRETPQNRLLYTVTWCETPYVWDNKIRKIGERKYDNDSYTITGLKPDTSYDIIIYVRDENGTENVYKRTTVRTLSDTASNKAPVLPNRVVTIDKINTNSIQISWEKATDKETAQNELKYKVQWVMGPSYSNNEAKETVYMTNVNSYKITGLYPNTVYRIQIIVNDGLRTSMYNALYVTTLPNEADKEKARRTAINAGLAGIPYRAADLINSTLYNDRTVYQDAIESLPDRDCAFLLSKSETTFDQKEIYVRGSGYENIYPGAILMVDDQITSGSPNPLGRIPRSKISIYGDFLAGGNPFQENVNPANYDVRIATNKIMEALLKDPRYDAPGMQRIRTKIHSSQQSLMMDLGVDASFAGCSLNVKAKTNSSEQTFIQATTLDQDYYTVKLKDNWKQDPSSLFDKSVTWEQLKKELNGKSIAIVTSVTYGRTFSYMKEYSAKKFTYDGSQKVSGYGQSANSSQSVAESSEYNSDEIFNLGGTALPISALRGKRTQAELEKAMSENMKFSHDNQGVVTKYTIQLISGSYPGKVVKPLYSGTQYQIGYTRCPRRLSVRLNVSDVTILSGLVKVQLDVQCFRVVNGKPVIFKTVNGSSPSKVQGPWWCTTKTSRYQEYGDLQPGEYIYKDPLLRVRAKVVKYAANDERRLNNDEISTGAMEVVMKGNVHNDSVRIVRITPL